MLERTPSRFPKPWAGCSIHPGGTIQSHSYTTRFPARPAAGDGMRRVRRVGVAPGARRARGPGPRDRTDTVSRAQGPWADRVDQLDHQLVQQVLLGHRQRAAIALWTREPPELAGDRAQKVSLQFFDPLQAPLRRHCAQGMKRTYITSRRNVKKCQTKEGLSFNP